MSIERDDDFFSLLFSFSLPQSDEKSANKGKHPLHGAVKKRMKLFSRLAPRPRNPFRRKMNKTAPAFYVPGEEKKDELPTHYSSDESK